MLMFIVGDIVPSIFQLSSLIFGIIRIKNEKIYKSTSQESLGQKMDRKVVFPAKFTEGRDVYLTLSHSRRFCNDCT